MSKTILRVLVVVAAVVAGGAIAGSIGAVFAGILIWGAFDVFKTQPRRRALMFVTASTIPLAALLYTIMNGHYIAFVAVGLACAATGFLLSKVPA
jgi:hypothetical protein